MKVEHPGLEQLVRFSELVDLLYTAVAAHTPLEALEPMSDSVTIAAAATSGGVTFKQGSRGADWRITGMGAKSQKGNSFTIESFVESHGAATRVNLVDYASGSSEYVSDRNSPIVVGVGRVLVVWVSAATAGDTITVTLQGYRLPTLGAVRG